MLERRGSDHGSVPTVPPVPSLPGRGDNDAPDPIGRPVGLVDRRVVLGALTAGFALAGCSTGSASSVATTTSAEPRSAAPTTSPRTGGVTTATPSATASATDTATATAAQTAQLPRGGVTVFPHYRLVGYCGHPGSAALGILGTGDLDQRVGQIEAMAASFDGDGRAVLPVLELIATVVHASPGDGTYRTRSTDQLIQQYLDAARRHQAYLLLNIQPGRADFLDEVRAYESWLTQPDVGVALDPEWAVPPGKVPGKVFGSVDASTLNAVGSYVSGLVAAHQLPEKVVLYHQLTASIVRNEQALQGFPGVAWVKSVDGIGTPPAKTATWTKLVALTPQPLVHLGFKLFLDEDSKPGPVMTPAQVMGLAPVPEYVMYE